MARLPRALAALALALALTGCGVTELNATGYVQGLLDSTYKGIHQETWLALVELTEEQAQADYQAGLEAELERLIQQLEMDSAVLTQEQREELAAWLAKLYARAIYSVDHATPSDSGAWLVEVTVRPITTPAALREQLSGLRERLKEDEAIPPSRWEQAWAAGVLELCRTAETQYGEAVTMAVRLAPDKEGYYSIGTQDFYHLDGLILKYEM